MNLNPCENQISRDPRKYYSYYAVRLNYSICSFDNDFQSNMYVIIVSNKNI